MTIRRRPSVSLLVLAAVLAGTAAAAILLEGCGQAPVKVQPADNARCSACHDNYQEELLAQSHAKAGVGCVDCHGKSQPHEEDKGVKNPPDVMFTPDFFMGAFCAKCHRTHNSPAVKVITMYQQRCAGKKRPEQIACTDCHGTHRLKARTVRWDKKTRELIPADPKR